MGFPNRKHKIKTRRLIRLNFNKTEVFNLYKFMAVLKSEIYTNDFFFPKNLKPKFKKVSLLIANCLINLFRKLNKSLKSSILEI